MYNVNRDKEDFFHRWRLQTTDVLNSFTPSIVGQEYTKILEGKMMATPIEPNLT